MSLNKKCPHCNNKTISLYKTFKQYHLFSNRKNITCKNCFSQVIISSKRKRFFFLLRLILGPIFIILWLLFIIECGVLYTGKISIFTIIYNILVVASPLFLIEFLTLYFISLKRQENKEE